jgi:D-arabinose 1-dehydrogenase-like Zn-dependent alcohol dehydrogenase
VLVTSFTNSALSSVYQRLCCAEGTIVYCGVPSSKEAFELDLEYLRFKGITVEGSFLGPTKLIPEMLSFFQEHKIEPMVQTCDFEDLPTVVKNGSKGKAPWVRTMVSVGRFGKESKLFSI